MEDINKLELSEIKVLCKKYGISPIGDKKSLVKKIRYYTDPVEDVLNTHPGRKIPEGNKILGVRIENREELNRILKKRGKFLYYSLGYQYYMVPE